MARRTDPDTALPLAAARADVPPGAKINLAKLFPGLRARHDGWTEERTQAFLDTLAHTGCIEDACRVSGLSDVGARRMRARFPAFAKAWNDALKRAQRGLVAVAYQRAVEGRETVIIRKGEEFERRIAPSDAMLGLLLKRGDLVNANAGVDATINFEEWRKGWRFTNDGRKISARQHIKEVTARLEAKFAIMRERMEQSDTAAGEAP